VLTSRQGGRVDPSRTAMLIGKGRHDVGCTNDAVYPLRAIRTPDSVSVRNFAPDRWPAGTPETGYTNVDDSPTKTFILSRFDNFYELSFGKRPMEELYSVTADPHNVKNLAADPKFAEIKRKLRERMEEMLREGDPRVMHTYAEWLKHNGSQH